MEETITRSMDLKHDHPPTGTPRITVLMPVYNGEDFLRATMESVLNQTYTDFEFLIINDGSTDASAEIAASFSDPRIRIECNERNLGLIATLNRGLGLARGEFIARMDADDLSYPTRFERQLAFLDAHPEIGACGTWFEKVTPQGTTVMRMPESPALIRLFLLFDNPFLHSSMMLRRTVLESHALRFDPAYPHSEDYDLWVRCSSITDMANMPEVLVRYNDHPANISHRFSEEQDTAANQIRTRQLTRLGISPNSDEIALHNEVIEFDLSGGLDRLESARNWLDKVLTLGSRKYHASATDIHAHLSRYWYGACGRLAGHGWQTWRLFRSSPLGRAAAFEWQWKLLLRCALRRSIP